MSDDGAKNKPHGSFGLVVTSRTTKQKKLKYKNPVHGSAPNSYQAETYGIVATLQCIFHFTNYYDCDIQLNWYHYIDNESLINRLNQLLTEISNNAFISDWDLFQYSKFTLD